MWLLSLVIYVAIDNRVPEKTEVTANSYTTEMERTWGILGPLPLVSLFPKVHDGLYNQREFSP